MIGISKTFISNECDAIHYVHLKGRCKLIILVLPEYDVVISENSFCMPSRFHQKRIGVTSFNSDQIGLPNYHFNLLLLIRQLKCSIVSMTSPGSPEEADGGVM